MENGERMGNMKLGEIESEPLMDSRASFNQVSKTIGCRNQEVFESSTKFFQVLESFLKFFKHD
jgi:hypothetical protein